MVHYALIVAGGSGNRMGTAIPKQFLELAGKPILMHSIEKFIAFESSIRVILVLPAGLAEYWLELKKKHSFSATHLTAAGGSTRFDSVKNGLELIDQKGFVAIHDGVRPLVSIETIATCFREAEKFGNAIPVTSPADSVRMITDQGNIPLNRQFLKFIQTPQVFDTDLIKKAYLGEYSHEITDDATLLEKTGESIHLVEGNRENIKITNPEDLLIAEALLQKGS